MLKFTDIDYEVLSDGASLVSAGRSPYERSTYRYTPLFAWIMTANIFFDCKWFGKVFFIVADVVCAHLMRLVALKLDDTEEVNNKYSVMICLSWLFNPFIIAISSRGNAESLVSCLVLATAFFLTDRVHVPIAAMMYALAVHVKIYPVIFSTSILMLLVRNPRNLFRFMVWGAISSLSMLATLFYMYN